MKRDVRLLIASISWFVSVSLLGYGFVAYDRYKSYFGSDAWFNLAKETGIWCRFDCQPAFNFMPLLVGTVLQVVVAILLMTAWWNPKK